MTEEELIKLKVQLAEDMREKREIQNVSRMMEEMAGNKSEHGKRIPGERGMYEIQRAKDKGLVWNGINYEN